MFTVLVHENEDVDADAVKEPLSFRKKLTTIEDAREAARTGCGHAGEMTSWFYAIFDSVSDMIEHGDVANDVMRTTFPQPSCESLESL